MKSTASFLFLLGLALSPALAQERPAPLKEAERQHWIQENYTKHEFMIPMRDGVKLFTQVFTPKDSSQTYPFLMFRTPYTVGPYGVDNYPSQLGPGQSELFIREGFIFVKQDVRGQGHSEGTFVNVRPQIANKVSPKDIDESSDAYDTIDWLVKNVPNHNGKAGIFGISYPGFYAATAAIDAHPALKAASPQAPVTNWFLGDDFRHNGVLMLPHAFNFIGAFAGPKPPKGWSGGVNVDMGTPDGYDYFHRLGPLLNADEKIFQGKVPYWRELIEHDVYDEYWQARDPRPFLKNVQPAMLTVGGWFDAEDVYGPLHVYAAAKQQGARSANLLVEGPWVHGGWSRGTGASLGYVQFRSNTSQYFQEKIEYPFFLYHLKGKGDGNKLPEAYVFETGRNEWHQLPAWPPKDAQARTLYFHADGRLGWDKPDSKAERFDEYISDPHKPVPFTPEISRGMTYNYMVEDQRQAASRTDVLAYETDPLESDVRIAGPLKATLYVSTSGTDSDFIVKLVDVYPGDAPDPDGLPANFHMGGYQQLVRGEPFRGRFRNSFEKPEAFTPGRVEKIEFELPDVFHAFRRGHRIMVQVQSSWFPLCDINPQKFMHIYDAKASDFQKAIERVYHTPETPSSLTVLRIE